MQDTVLEMDTGGEVEGAKHKIRSLLSGAHDAAGEIRPHTGKNYRHVFPGYSPLGPGKKNLAYLRKPWRLAATLAWPVQNLESETGRHGGRGGTVKSFLLF